VRLTVELMSGSEAVMVGMVETTAVEESDTSRPAPGLPPPAPDAWCRTPDA
jgi:hypothetical protein